MMSHRIELARGSRRRRSSSVVPSGTPDFVDSSERLHSDTVQIERLGAEGCRELNRFQFVRLSQKLEEKFHALRVRRLKDLCLVANHSEEFFLSVSKSQWLRTVITCNKHRTAFLFEEAIQRPRTTHSSSFTIRSVVVPRLPYWTKLQAVRDEAAGKFERKRLYFPSTFLESAVSEEKSLVDKLNEWEEREAQGDVVNQMDETDDDEGTSSRPFWKIGRNDVQEQKRNYGKGSQAEVWKISWRGGMFARKSFNHEKIFDNELKVVRRLCHPHIVYNFGMSTSEKPLFLLMELLDRDLHLLIEDRVRQSGPPFSCLDSLDILLQIARAMEYMHGLAEPVIHGDLKAQNVLVSEDCEVLGDVRQFLVKVADFGSARILELNSESPFIPGACSIKFAAPEVLERIREINSPKKINFPKKIDVYSFGIIAFQVLTGLVPYEKSRSVYVAKEGVSELVRYRGASSQQALKEGVIAGNLRPPLREACGRPEFWNDSNLMSLVESCWDGEPSARPEFSEIITLLGGIYNSLNQGKTNGGHALAETLQADAINGASQEAVNGAHVAPPAQVSAVDDGPVQNHGVGSPAFPQPQTNGPQVSGLPSVHDTSREGSRMKGFRFLRMLSCTCKSPGTVSD